MGKINSKQFNLEEFLAFLVKKEPKYFFAIRIAALRRELKDCDRLKIRVARQRLKSMIHNTKLQLNQFDTSNQYLVVAREEYIQNLERHINLFDMYVSTLEENS